MNRNPATIRPSGAESVSQSLALRLANVRVSLREDLEVTRHVFRGQPAYVVRDPLTGQSQRLDKDDYFVFLAISAERTLGAVFQDLVERGVLAAKDEERFFVFIMALHGLSFLRLPLADHALLYRRHEAKIRAKRLQWLTGLLFLRIPLWNPNAFLERTLHLARGLFSAWCFTGWVLVMLLAGYVTVRQWDRLYEPLEGMFVAGNLPVLWITLVLLKIFHEFGHAYACKHYGGHVPEMGAYLILFTPCAYVDATSSWGFSRMRDRIVVCLAGMYVESFFAAAAAVIWALTPPSPVHSLAYNVMFLGSIVTLFFNLNPLMRYDGYYVLSDLAQVPNLRERSARYVLQLLKRGLLGIVDSHPPAGWRLKLLLVSYGAAASAYRVALVVGIALLLASKFLFLGLLLGAVYAGGTLIKTLRRLMHYLWHADETSPVRRRAVALGTVVLVIVPAAAAWVPLPRHVRAAGVLMREGEQVIRVKSPGFLTAAKVTPGQYVLPGDVLAELDEDTYFGEWADAETQLRAARIRVDAHRVSAPSRAMEENAKAQALARALHEAETKLADLRVRAAAAGEVVETVTGSETGRYLTQGYPIARVVSGEWHVLVVISDEQLTLADLREGDAVEFRAAGRPGKVLSAVVRRVAPAATREGPPAPLTQKAGGSLAVDVETGRSFEPFFEVTLALRDPVPDFVRYGMTGAVRFALRREALAASCVRRLQGLWNLLNQG